MPNRTEHLVVSAIAGACLTAFTHQDQFEVDYWKSIGLGALGGACGGCLPDTLDPPTSPLHRSYAHGCIPLCMAPVLALSVQHPFVQGFGIGYTTHLVQDSFTPMGLPL